VRVQELAQQEVADPASDQIRAGSARPTASDAEPESHHCHDVHGNGGKDTHNQANNERTAFHRTAFPPLLVRPLPNEKKISHGRMSWQTRWSYSAMEPLASSNGQMTARHNHNPF